MGKSNTVRVVLEREHYHRNEHCQPGKTIDVTPEQADWLERDGIARRSNSTVTEELSDEGATS